MKRTPWYPASVKPARVGWYEVRLSFDHGPMMERWHWDGEYWTDELQSDVWMCKPDKWRGLTEAQDE